MVVRAPPGRVRRLEVLEVALEAVERECLRHSHRRPGGQEADEAPERQAYVHTSLFHPHALKLRPKHSPTYTPLSHMPPERGPVQLLRCAPPDDVVQAPPERL